MYSVLACYYLEIIVHCTRLLWMQWIYVWPGDRLINTTHNVVLYIICLVLVFIEMLRMRLHGKVHHIHATMAHSIVVAGVVVGVLVKHIWYAKNSCCVHFFFLSLFLPIDQLNQMAIYYIHRTDHSNEPDHILFAL